MPDLNGLVAVLDNAHNVISVVNVSVLLAADHHDHPHDATFLSNGASFLCFSLSTASTTSTSTISTACSDWHRNQQAQKSGQ